MGSEVGQHNEVGVGEWESQFHAVRTTKGTLMSHHGSEPPFDVQLHAHPTPNKHPLTCLKAEHGTPACCLARVHVSTRVAAEGCIVDLPDQGMSL